MEPVGWGLANIARHVIDTRVEPSCLELMASYDVASNICGALRWGAPIEYPLQLLVSHSHALGRDAPMPAPLTPPHRREMQNHESGPPGFERANEKFCFNLKHLRRDASLRAASLFCPDSRFSCFTPVGSP